MEIRFTQDQQKVIDLHNRNILVSAAAGSGKTAVLVERIVQMISDEQKQIDIDRLLIVTFTSAAAAEMRERIGDAIMQKLEENPQNEHLQKQSTLLHYAQITTISSFCLFVLRNHFNDIGLDPGFRVADEGELKLLKKEVLSSLLEERFAQGEEDFIDCVETYSLNGSEKALEDYILKLYHFSISHPWPQKWLEQCKSEYAQVFADKGGEAKWMMFLQDYLRRMITDTFEQIENAILVCEQPDGPYLYLPLLEKEKEFCKRLMECSDYQSYADCLQTLNFDRLPSKKDDTISLFKRELVKNIRNASKDCLLSIKKEFFYTDTSNILVDLEKSSGAVNVLIESAIAFSELFAEKKKERNIIDFSDMEHFALDILVREVEGEPVPTKTAEIFRDYFEEILIDEYQDSNLVQEYLLQSISGESKGMPNRFMVGDVKQSIYKFRLARPEIFMEKYESYSLEDSGKQRIDLQKNFRSRKEVIEGVNYIFSQIMEKKIGGIDYDDKASLHMGAAYEEALQDQSMELILVEKGEDNGDEEISKIEAEALAIALRIKQMAGTFQVTDKKTGKLRPANYSDMVILLRSNAGWDEELKRILLQEGIPTHVTSKTGYFSAWEVQLVLNFLRILDNPLQDIPLCAILVSPIIGFTEEELSIIKAEGSLVIGGKRKTKWYRILKNYEINGRNELLKEKITNFLQMIYEYRKKVPYTPIHELLQLLLRDLNIELFITAMPAGGQRNANLEMLLEKAVRFESTSYHGLFHFIRYMEQMEKYDVDFGEANILDENADTVRIMSIHKSKGLEFPICFAAGLSKKFNKLDIRKSLVIDMDYGIGADYIDPVKRIKAPTLRKNAIIRKMELDNLGEELRILYVAMTRAKEKLIMTAAVSKLEKKLIDLQTLQAAPSKTLSFAKRMQSNCYLDLVLASLISHSGFQTILQEKGISVETKKNRIQEEPNITICLMTEESLVKEKMKEEITKEFLKERLEQNIEKKKADKHLLRIMEERFAFSYPYQNLARLYTKTTVSELKKAKMYENEEAVQQLYPEEEMVPYLPKFMREAESMSGTTRGSAYHRVLELIDIEKINAGKEKERGRILTEELENLQKTNKLSKEYKEAIRESAILQFLHSNLAGRMAEAGKKNRLYREQPFVMAIPAKRLDKEFPETESILVQGIMDVYFEEDDGLVVADYKTDQVTSEQELIERYQVQLEYYSEALEKLLDKPVKEKIIYSFALEKEIVLRNS